MHPLIFYPLGTVLLITFWNYIVMPYREFRDERLDLVSQARAYIVEHCIGKGDIRVQFAAFDKCADAEKTVKSSPRFDAWTDLMNSWQLRLDLTQSANLFALVGYGVAALVLAFVAVCFLNTFSLVRSTWKTFQDHSQLPMTTKQKKMF
jgi:hypothetical protein